MTQDKSQTKSVDAASAEATLTEAAINASAEAASAEGADRSDTASEATSLARGKRGGTAMRKPAGNGEAGTGSDHVSGQRITSWD